MRSNVLVIFMLFGGVFFTVFAGIAWQMGRRVGAVLLAVVAGIDIALAIQFLRNAFER